MNTPPSFDESPFPNTLHDEVHTLRGDAARMAREHIVEPAVAMVHDAQQAVHQGAKRAQAVITEKLGDTRKAIADGVAHAQKSVTGLRDRVSARIAANPFASIGIAVLVGAVLLSAGRRHQG